MTRLASLLVVLLLAPSGCATRGSVDQTRTEVTALTTEVQALRFRQESVTRSLDRLTSEVRAAQAEMAAVSPQLNAEAANVRWLGERIDEVSRDVKRVAGRPRGPNAPDALPSPSPPAGGNPDRASAGGTAAPAAGGTSRRVDAGEQTFHGALDVFQVGEYAQAVLDFSAFLTQYPDHPLAGRAQFWVGQAYYEQGDYRQALAEFTKVRTAFAPNGASPDALLMAGLCHDKLDNPAYAREAWQQVVRDYPKSDAAEKARAYIRTRAASSRR